MRDREKKRKEGEEEDEEGTEWNGKAGEPSKPSPAALYRPNKVICHRRELGRGGGGGKSDQTIFPLFLLIRGSTNSIQRLNGSQEEEERRKEEEEKAGL